MLAALALAALPLAPQEATPAAPPHVLFVMVDDLGWRDSAPGAWPDPEGPGARHFLTPHLERLAAEGVRFSDAYASCAVCTPTRTSLMTGSAPARTRITNGCAADVSRPGKRVQYVMRVRAGAEPVMRLVRVG
ncbi:MAG: sulfatase-like hydrolase/transferase, partial [Planctomycetota bacterium]